MYTTCVVAMCHNVLQCMLLRMPYLIHERVLWCIHLCRSVQLSAGVEMRFDGFPSISLANTSSKKNANMLMGSFTL